jgi:exopolysaccharide/PEP-CTERM locus tyrosine autokinase
MSRIKDALKKAKLEREGLKPVSMAYRPVQKPDSRPITGKIQTKIISYSEDAAKKHKLITPYLEDPDLAERLKLLRTKVLSETQANDDRTILITSSLDKEGKTFIAVNLAITFAREVDQTVLLVDVNLKNPSVLNVFGIQAEEGLTDYLLHDKSLSDLLIRPGIEKLVILPSGKPVENSAELLRSLKMQDLVKEMKNRYGDRYIFFDAPSILTSVDTVVMSKYIDRTLFVIESGRVQPEKVLEALKLLEEDKILGTILNKRDIAGFQ